ncbi:hypothetical protein K432DRAFT_364441 [Lepidopterella palustris CBS 459.81]|uniref:Endonuclease/exonuclease/phosphatase domain-containing protein n=1 Tax=Lepidopterella palustris CBS 459.81 TaxID=1314670 RepID=A0A8E2J926_9PEZI|nr:hypothetical protein K432DRAFT_364441 [Lepidopterella palustris CBS 459.81]
MSYPPPPQASSLLAQLTARQLERIPERQSYYYFINNSWRPVFSNLPPPSAAASPKPSSNSSPETPPAQPPPTTSTLHILTWNIDFSTPYAPARLSAALTHLSHLLSTRIPASSPVLIFLQEMIASDLHQLSCTPWIRDHFAITDIDTRNWGSHYGTVTLVDRRLSVREVGRLRFVSECSRDGLGVDLDVGVPEGEGGRVLRLCNSHLESLASNPPMRPLQMMAVARWLQEDNVVAGVLAGDMNAIRGYDVTLPQENGFKDAYLELGGQEDGEDGMTWGYQSAEWVSKRFGPGRLDKLLFCGAVGVRRLERIGVGVVVEEEGIRRKMREEGKVEFVTDHYGLMAELVLGEGVGVRMRGEKEIEELVDEGGEEDWGVSCW